MKVTTIAYTAFSFGAAAQAEPAWLPDSTATIFEGQALIEFAGRNCYQSWHKPNADTRANRDYVRSLIAKQHFSVLEHASVTFYITGVSRNFTHELIRHRHLSFSELSQRYVDVSEQKYVVPPALAGGRTFEHSAVAVARGSYKATVAELEASGVSRKQAREAARYVLPSGLETKIVVTGNIRAWWEFLTKRLSPQADAEMQQVARAIMSELETLYPDVFAKFEDDA